MDARNAALFGRALFASLLAFSFGAQAQVPPPCALCTSTVIAWESTRDGNAEIYVAAPDGSGVRRLTNHAASDQSPAVSPDGQRIAFTSDRAGFLAVHVMNADGSNVVRVPAAVDHAFGPVWSPDGTMLAFNAFHGGNFDIYVVRLDGTGLRRITTSPAEDSAPSWSPDGSLIAFHSDRSGDYEIYTVNVYTLQERRLTTHAATDGLPAWSPDGRSIAFASTRAGEVEWDIYVMNADGSGVVQVTSGAGIDSAPSWSPDGTQIAFERFPSFTTNTPDIHRVGRDGTGLARVTQSGADRAPSWGAAVIPGVNVQAATATVQLRYRDIAWAADAPLSATGAMHWIEGDLMRSADTLALDLGRLGDSTLVEGLAPGNFELRLAYGKQRGSRLIEIVPRTPVRIVAASNSLVLVDVSRFMGVIKGLVTVNGAAPGAGLSLCLRAHGWCMDLPESGEYSVLLPRGSGEGVVCSSELVTPNGCFAPTKPPRPGEAAPLYREFVYQVDDRRSTLLPVIAFRAPLAHVRLFYKDRSWSERRPLSAIGAMHWIDGQVLRQDIGALEMERMGDSTLVEGLAAGNYEVRLLYGPQEQRSGIRGFELLSRSPLAILADTTSTLDIDVTRGMGVLEGAVTLNGTAPGTGLSVCLERRYEYRWCQELPESGAFSVLLPRGRGDGAVCSSELVTHSGCQLPPRPTLGALMRRFTYDVSDGETTRLMATIAFSAPLTEVALMYRDLSWSEAGPLSATGAMHWIEGQVMRAGTPLVTLALGRVGDSALVEGLVPANYELRLLYGPQTRSSGVNGDFEFAGRVTLPVVADTTSRARVDVSQSMGVVKGALVVNGGAPGAGLSICFARRSDYRWCTDLPANGQFSALLPRGGGAGEICSSELVKGDTCETSPRPPRPGQVSPVLLDFNYQVDPQTTTDVTQLIRPR